MTLAPRQVMSQPAERGLSEVTPEHSRWQLTNAEFSSALE